MPSNSDDSKIVKGCLTVVIAVVITLIVYVPLLIYFTWAGSVVLSHLWDWFIVPVFNLPSLTLLQAAGLALVVGYLTKVPISSAKGEDDQVKHWTTVIFGLLFPWITLLIGYVIYTLM